MPFWLLRDRRGLILTDELGYPVVFFNPEDAEEAARRYGLIAYRVEEIPKRLEVRKRFTSSYYLAGYRKPVQITLGQQYLDYFTIVFLAGLCLASVSAVKT